MNLPDAFPRAVPPPQDLAAALERVTERASPLATRVLWYPEVSSTNDIASALAEGGAPEGTIVIADAQTAGRGRHRRTWSSPAGAGLYVSIVLRPSRQARALLTIAAGVALADGIAAATGLRTALKWPNDVMVAAALNRRPTKLAGILAEASSGNALPLDQHGATLQACVLGFGINVTAAAYPADVASRATSLERELDRPVDRASVLVECLAALASRYDDLRHGRSAAVLDAWRIHARPLLGRRVEWDGPAGIVQGVAEDIDASGALLVQTRDATVRVISGDVRWT